LLETQRDIEIVGECGNAIEAIGAVHKLRPDVLFLDIQMPRISGLEMVGMLDPNTPYIVFLTAFDEYAVKAFEEHAFDYLLKPIEAARLEKRSPACARSAICRMSRCWTIPAGAEIYSLHRAQPDLAAADGGCGLCQQPDERDLRDRPRGKEGFTELTLRTLESRTPLLRCHRQYLVNMAHLKEIRLEENGQAELLMRAGQTVPVSRRYLKSLKEAIGL
jgi:two-component system LytT family response regulator